MVITDDMQMRAISDQYGLANAIKLAINAGVDILLFGNRLISITQNPKQLIDIIYNSIQLGEISEKRINEAYQRIMKLKAQIKKNMYNN
ncbi:glycoside hydrolase family 3 N-terminal domain-containing protein [Wolbachia endosymbiont (group E) of Neria commutata]|uniref:glycoside hydrolase family 3 N-terminal domain-containing protein n=1 Tax=Wolbachia endosymbiont (group E) of Neria commutata TaxID=3066149 RepID=UPI0031332D01